MVARVITVDITGRNRLSGVLSTVGTDAERAAAKAAGAFDKSTSRIGSSFAKIGNLGASFGLPFAGALGTLGSKLDETSVKGKKFGSTLSAIGGAELLAAGAAVAFIGTASVKAAAEFDTSQARLQAAVKDTGVSFASVKGDVSETNQRFVKLGFTSTDTENALSRLTASTKDVGKAQQYLGVAADISRARNIDLQSATDLLSKAQVGNYLSLRRLGLASKDQIKTFHSMGDVVAFLTSKFGGQAQAYVGTFQGKLDALKATSNQLEVGLGNALIPRVEQFASATVGTVGALQTANAATHGWFGNVALLAGSVPVAAFAVGKLDAAGVALAGSFRTAATSVGLMGASSAEAAAGETTLVAAQSRAAVAAANLTLAESQLPILRGAEAAANQRVLVTIADLEAAEIALRAAEVGDVEAAASVVAARKAVATATAEAAAASKAAGGAEATIVAGANAAKFSLGGLALALGTVVIGIKTAQAAAHNGGLTLPFKIPGIPNAFGGSKGGGYDKDALAGGAQFVASGKATAEVADKIGASLSNAQRALTDYTVATLTGKKAADTYTSTLTDQQKASLRASDGFFDVKAGIDQVVQGMGPAEKAQLRLSLATQQYQTDLTAQHPVAAQTATDLANLRAANDAYNLIQTQTSAALSGQTQGFLGLGAAIKTAADASQYLQDQATGPNSAFESTIGAHKAASAFSDAVAALHGSNDTTSSGGGGGQTATAAAIEQQQKEIALRDALLGVKDAATGVASAEQSLADAHRNAAAATQTFHDAQRNLQTVLKGVAADSRAAKEAVDAYKSAQDAAASSKLDVHEAQRSLAQAKNDQALLGLAVKDAQAKLLADRTGTTGQTQFVPTPTGSKQISVGGTGPADAETILKDQIALRDAQIAASGASDTVKRAEIALNEARLGSKKQVRDLTDAQRTLNGTLHGYPPASREAKDAQKQLTDAQIAARDATQAISTASRQLITAQNNTRDSTLALFRAQADLDGKLTASSGAKTAKHNLEDFITKLDDAAQAAVSQGDLIRKHTEIITGSVALGIQAEINNLLAAVQTEPLIANAVQGILNTLKQQYADTILKERPGGPSGPTIAQIQTIGKKAFGGPGYAGKPEWTGELGPELYVPKSSGDFISHSALENFKPAGGDVTYVINIAGPIMGTDVEQVVHNAMKNITRKNGSVAGVRTSG